MYTFYPSVLKTVTVNFKKSFVLDNCRIIIIMTVLEVMKDYSLVTKRE